MPKGSRYLTVKESGLKHHIRALGPPSSTPPPLVAFWEVARSLDKNDKGPPVRFGGPGSFQEVYGLCTIPKPLEDPKKRIHLKIP